MEKQQLSVISLFSGGMGLDLGLEQAGFKVVVAVECNKNAAETIRKNRPDIKLLEKKIENLKSKDILAAAELAPGEPTLVVGGPSCQSFSTVGQRGSIRDPRGGMFRHFVRVVRETRPRFFVMENVTGLLSAAVKHRPLNKRGPGHPALRADEEFGSAFNRVLAELKKLGYHITFDVLNAADFGVPQTRERLVCIGSRDGEPIQMPLPTYAKKKMGPRAKWVSIKKALKGLKDPKPVIKTIAARWKKYLKHIPAGGCWRDLPSKRMQRAALGKAYNSWGGRKGFFRRLAWDRPAPALTTRPESKATMMCHPDEIRAFSVREYARLQQFPDDWQFAGPLEKQYMQVGNAVPVGLGKAIGLAIMQTIATHAPKSRAATIVCASDHLLQRLINGRRTRLNPVRMRKVKGLKAVKKWLNGRTRARLGILKYVEPTALENTVHTNGPTPRGTRQAPRALQPQTA